MLHRFPSIISEEFQTKWVLATAGLEVPKDSIPVFQGPSKQVSFVKQTTTKELVIVVILSSNVLTPTK